MIKLLNTEPEGYSLEAKSILDSFAHVSSGPYKREYLLKKGSLFDGLIVRLSHLIDKNLIDAFPDLKVIATATTGLDHIDCAYAESKGIKILSLKNQSEFLEKIYATAEHTWALILALLRNIPSASQSVSHGYWNRDQFKGHELHGKTIGIVGLGRIGNMVAKYAKAFGMSVIANTKEDVSQHKNVKIVKDLDKLLNISDIVTIHVPLTPDTKNLIGDKEFKEMKKNALLINTSRGELVDEVALIHALKNNTISGAALDVIVDENKMIENGYSKVVEFSKSNRCLIITPHLGGATYESMEKSEIFIANKLKLYFT
tara:strand:- start:10498 stop:11442 length:945 start_codon:yes stop_codon:yes gene_type:complete